SPSQRRYGDPGVRGTRRAPQQCGRRARRDDAPAASPGGTRTPDAPAQPLTRLGTGRSFAEGAPWRAVSRQPRGRPRTEDRMALVGYFRTMARNNAWSNHRLLGACARLTPEELDAPRTGFFPSLRLTLSHILLVDGYYLDALEGAASSPDLDEAATPWGTLEELRAAQRDSDRRLIAYCDALTPERLSARVVFDRGAGARPLERIDRSLAHL